MLVKIIYLYKYYDTENFLKHCQKVDGCLTLANLNYITLVDCNASVMPPSKHSEH